MAFGSRRTKLTGPAREIVGAILVIILAMQAIAIIAPNISKLSLEGIGLLLMVAINSAFMFRSTIQDYEEGQTRSLLSAYSGTVLVAYTLFAILVCVISIPLFNFGNATVFTYAVAAILLIFLIYGISRPLFSFIKSPARFSMVTMFYFFSTLLQMLWFYYSNSQTGALGGFFIGLLAALVFVTHFWKSVAKLLASRYPDAHERHKGWMKSPEYLALRESGKWVEGRASPEMLAACILIYSIMSVVCTLLMLALA